MKFNIFSKMLSFVILCLEVIKIAIASVVSVTLLGLACLTFTGSTMGFLISTPLFIIFSPILVPATIATTFVATGLTAGTSLGGAALGLIILLIKTRMGTFAEKPQGQAAAAGAAAPAKGQAAAPATGQAAAPATGQAAAGGAAAEPTSQPAPAGGLPKIMGTTKWTWTRDGAPFSGGWFGGAPEGEGVGGKNQPGVVLNWAWTGGLLGKTYHGHLPFGGFPAGGGPPAGGTPAGGPSAE